MRTPPIVCGSTIESVVRQRGTPRARLASRSEFGTRTSTSIVARATSGSIRQASANAPAQPLWPRPTTIRPKTKIPITIAGTPFSTSSTRLTAVRIAGGANSIRYTATRMPTGSAIKVARPTSTNEPAKALASPCFTGPNANGTGPFVIRSRLSAPAPRFATDHTTMTRIATAIAAAKVASPSISRFTRRRRGRCTSCRSARVIPCELTLSLPGRGCVPRAARSAARRSSSRARTRGGSTRGRSASRPGACWWRPGRTLRSCSRACRRR